MKHPAFLSIEVSRWVVWLVVLACMVPVVSADQLAVVTSKSLIAVDYAIGGDKWEYIGKELNFIKDGKKLANSQWNIYDKSGQRLTQYEVNPIDYTTEVLREPVCTQYQTTHYGNVTEYKCGSYELLMYGNGSTYWSCNSQVVHRVWANETKTCTASSMVDKQRVAVLNQSWDFFTDEEHSNYVGTLMVSARTDHDKTKFVTAYAPARINELNTMSWMVSGIPRVNKDLMQYSSITYGTHSIDWTDLRQHVQHVQWEPTGELEIFLNPKMGYQEYDPQMGGTGYEDRLFRYYNLSEGSAPNKYDETRNLNATSTAPITASCIRGNCINISSAPTSNDAVNISMGFNWDFGINVNYTANMWYRSFDGTVFPADPLLFGLRS